MKIPPDRLDPETLRAIALEFVSREGSEYGHQEWSMEQKVEQVIDQVRAGEVHVFYDENSKTCNLVTSKDARIYQGD